MKNKLILIICIALAVVLTAVIITDSGYTLNILPAGLYSSLHESSLSVSSGPLSIINVSAIGQGKSIRFQFYVENTGNSTIRYIGGCLSPIFALNNTVNLTHVLNCDAITEQQLHPGQLAAFYWPYPAYVNLSGEKNLSEQIRVYLGFEWQGVASNSTSIENISFDFSG